MNKRNGSTNKKFISFFSKMFATLLIISLCIFASLLLISQETSRNSLIEQKSNDTVLLVEFISKFLDIYQQNIATILYSIKNSEGFLTSDSEQRSDILRNHHTINSAMIGNLYFINRQREVNAHNPLIFDIVGQPELMNLYDQALLNMDLIKWSEPYYSPMLTMQTIAVSLPMKNENGMLEGVIIAELDLNWLNGQMNTFSRGRDQSIVILSPQGQVITVNSNRSLLPFITNTLPRTIEPNFLNQLRNVDKHVHQIRTDTHQLMSVKHTDTQLGWQLIMLIDESTFTESVQELSQKLINVGLLFLVLLFLASYLISRQFSRPIRILAAQMDRIQGEKLLLSTTVPLHRNDELGALSKSFHALLQRIRTLIEDVKLLERRKQQIEFKMLMSQIRPHFLYNTLNSIRSLARSKRYEDIDHTIRSLVKLLMFSIDKKDDMITIEEELTCLRAYVQILEVRNDKHIDCFIQVSPEHFKFMLPKLILQPLIENCIFHGFAKMNEGLIVIQSTIHHSSITISVTDNGHGLPSTDLTQLTSKKADDSLNHIGLINVHERIKLHFGSDYGISVADQPATGTIINIKLPLVLQDKNGDD